MSHLAPTFSVVVPAYNAADTIESTLRSVLAQTRPDFEVIVVDDGSTDDTAARAEALGDPRIRVVRQENGGTAVALNTGIAHARGEFVTLLGADDLYLPTYLEVMERTLAAAPDAGFAYADAWVLDRRTHRISRTTASEPQRPPIPPPDDPIEFLTELLDRNFVFGLAMVRREAFEQVGPFVDSLRNRQDHEMWLRLVAHGFRGVLAPGLLSIYRRLPGGRSVSVSSNLLASAKAEREVYRRVAEEYDVPESVRRLARRRMVETEAAIEAVRASQARRRLVPTRLRRLVGRGYRAIRYRHTWYDTPPPEVAAAFPDLQSL